MGNIVYIGNKPEISVGDCLVDREAEQRGAGESCTDHADLVKEKKMSLLFMRTKAVAMPRVLTNSY